METSLHRQLKHRYADAADRTEVAVDGFRIDALRDDCLVEIQHGGLAAIRDKVRRLVQTRSVLVVKPIIVRRTLMKRREPDGPATRRLSPKRGGPLDLFDDLVHFTRVFPHPNLTIEAPLVEVEEWRLAAAPAQRRRRRWQRDYVVEDRKLVCVGETLTLRAAHDLLTLLPAAPPPVFTTADLSALLNVARWRAQRIAYCLRQAGVCTTVGKRGNSLVYALAPQGRKRRGKASA